MPQFSLPDFGATDCSCNTSPRALVSLLWFGILPSCRLIRQTPHRCLVDFVARSLQERVLLPEGSESMLSEDLRATLRLLRHVYIHTVRRIEKISVSMTTGMALSRWRCGDHNPIPELVYIVLGSVQSHITGLPPPLNRSSFCRVGSHRVLNTQARCAVWRAP